MPRARVRVTRTQAGQAGQAVQDAAPLLAERGGQQQHQRRHHQQQAQEHHLAHDRRGRHEQVEDGVGQQHADRSPQCPTDARHQGGVLEQAVLGLQLRLEPPQQAIAPRRVHGIAFTVGAECSGNHQDRSLDWEVAPRRKQQARSDTIVNGRRPPDLNGAYGARRPGPVPARVPGWRPAPAHTPGAA